MKVSWGELPARRPVRPMRCASEETVDGASSWKMWSRSPTSMPSSRLLVATSVASRAFSKATLSASSRRVAADARMVHVRAHAEFVQHPREFLCPGAALDEHELLLLVAEIAHLRAAAALVPWPTCQEDRGASLAAGATTAGALSRVLPASHCESAVGLPTVAERPMR
jgi:hypothetical protein